MATVYKVKITSHWVNYTEEALEEKLNKLLKGDDRRNQFSVEVERT